jgi:hypothetical protein
VNWFQRLDEKRNLLVGGTITLCVAMLAVTARRAPASFDVFWHIQTGIDWIEKGLSPWIDHYSFTFDGHPILTQPFMFQATVAWLVEQFGLEPGLQVFKFVSFVSVLGIIATFLKFLRSPTIIYLVVLPLVVVLLQLRALTRPELVSYSLLVLAVILYHRSKLTISARTVLPIMLLMLFWGNYHSSILGYVVFFGLYVDSALLNLKEHAGIERWTTWLITGLILFGIGFLNPTLSHSFINSLNFDPQWKVYIQEYGSSYSFYGSNFALISMLVIALATLVTSACRHRFGYFIVTAVLLFQSLQMARLVAPAGIVILCIFSSLMSDANLKSYLKSARDTMTNRVIFTCAICSFLVTLVFGVSQARGYMEENLASKEKFPRSIVQYMKRTGVHGNILNEYGIGGFLIKEMAPAVKVYIDGRTNILYPIDHYDRYIEIRNSPEDLAQELESYDINSALLKLDANMFSVAFDSGRLKLDFAGEQFAFFKIGQANFPVSGELLAYPACWNEDKNSALQSEKDKAIWTLTGTNLLLPWLGMVTSFQASEDQPTFLEQLGESPYLSEHQARFAAYQALRLGRFKLATNFFSRYGGWNQSDFIAVAFAHYHMDNWKEAEAIIDHTSKIPWPYVTPGQGLLLYRILKNIENDHGLSLIPPEYLDKLKSSFSGTESPPSNLKLDFTLFCNA